MIRRRFRQFLVASLIAFHAAVTLCGPCLHELPGLGHESASQTQPTDQHPFKSPHDSGDSCPVCHFLSHGQLPVTLASFPVTLTAGAWVHPHSCSIEIDPSALACRQRAPPIVAI